MNYAYQQPAQPLPYDPTAVRLPYLSLNLSTPPSLPQIQCDPYYQQFIPLISAMCALEIQNNSQTNALRIFMFNQYGRNSFRNEDFDALVSAALDYVVLSVTKRTFANAETACQECVPRMVEMLCAVNVKMFPALAPYAPPNSMQAVQNMIQMFDSIAAEITHMKRSGGVVQPQQPMQMGYAPPIQQGVPQVYGGYQQPVQYGTSPQLQRAGASTGLFNNTNIAPPVAFPASQSQQMGRDMTGRYGTDTRAPDPAILQQVFTPRDAPAQSVAPTFYPTPNQQPVSAVQYTPPVEDVEITHEVQYVSKWRPSIKYPYPLAYNPLTHRLLYEVDDDGEVKPVLEEINGDDMDYDRHAITPLFGMPPKRDNVDELSEPLKLIQEGIDQIHQQKSNAEAAADTPEGEEPAPVVEPTAIKKEWLAEISLRAAWFIGVLERSLVMKDDKVPYVYRVYAKIAEPLLSFNDETSIIKGFGRSTTFIELRDKLLSAQRDISPALYTACNLRLTAMVNQILLRNMSLPETSIDDFVADIEDLIKLLENKYGMTIRNAFLKGQKDKIQATFVDLEDNIVDLLSSNLVDGRPFPEGAVPKIGYLAKNYSLTYLNCNANELEIELPKKIGAAITKSYTPVMRSLVTELFEDTKNLGNFAHHLIRTNDGRILEATKGHIGDDFYLLSLVK